VRDGCRLEVCGVGAGKISQLLWGRGRFKYCGCRAGADTKFQPTQDSKTYPHYDVTNKKIKNFPFVLKI